MCIKVAKLAGGIPLEFSRPGEMAGLEGKGRERVLMEGDLERRGVRRGRFDGVTTIVRERFLRERRCAKSRNASIWPCAG